MAMRILPDFLMSSSASAFATWLTPIIAASATASAVRVVFIVSSSLKLLSARIHVGELGDPAAELFRRRELGVEVGGDQVPGEPGTDDLRADAQDVDVIVLDALVRRMHVMADRGPDALHLVGADRGAHAGAADHQPALGPAGRDRGRDLAGDVGEVDGGGIVGADVEHLVALLLQEGEDLGFHRKAGMVGADDELHERFLLDWWVGGWWAGGW